MGDQAISAETRIVPALAHGEEFRFEALAPLSNWPKVADTGRTVLTISAGDENATNDTDEAVFFD